MARKLALTRMSRDGSLRIGNSFRIENFLGIDIPARQARNPVIGASACG